MKASNCSYCTESVLHICRVWVRECCCCVLSNPFVVFVSCASILFVNNGCVDVIKCFVKGNPMNERSMIASRNECWIVYAFYCCCMCNTKHFSSAHQLLYPASLFEKHHASFWVTLFRQLSILTTLRLCELFYRSNNTHILNKFLWNRTFFNGKKT